MYGFRVFYGFIMKQYSGQSVDVLSLLLYICVSYGVRTLWCEMLKEQKSIRDDPSSSFRTIIVE